MDTLGAVETPGIASGVWIADAMMKAADVELLRASTICGGRYLIFVAGDRRAVETAVEAAAGSGRRITARQVVSNISPMVVDALRRSAPASPRDALGVVESRVVADAVQAADAAVKRSDVRILRFVSGQGIMGKAYFVLGGEVAAVREAVKASSDVLGERMVESVVIPNPDGSVVRQLTGSMRQS